MSRATGGWVSSGSGPENDGEVGPNSTAWVYAVGSVEPRLSSPGLEKEFAQATARTATKGLTDRAVLHKVLSDRGNRYLVRQLCWVFTVAGLETYIMRPRCGTDLELLVDAISPAAQRSKVSVVVGARGPLAPGTMCGGLSLPMVIFDQLYTFDVDTLITAIPRPDQIAVEQFEPVARELFDRIMQMADNTGATDEHRALNYLAVRYPAIYAITSQCHGRNFSLSAVEVRSSRLSSIRNVVDVILSFTSRDTDVTEKYFARVDVTEEFPFLVTRLGPFFDR